MHLFLSGVELYALQTNKQGLQLHQQFQHIVTWWKFSHHAKLLLLGTLDKNMWVQVGAPTV